MKIIIPFITVVLLGAFFACSTSNGMNEKQQPETVVLNVSSFEAQDVFPGVFSNIKKNRNYIVKASGTFSDSTSIKYLLVDSIKLPVRFVSVNGAKLKSPQDLIIGDNVELVVHAGRNYYNDEAPQTYEAENYQAADMEMKGKSYLEFRTSLGSQYVVLPELTLLDPVYAP